MNEEMTGGMGEVKVVPKRSSFLHRFWRAIWRPRIFIILAIAAVALWWFFGRGTGVPESQYENFKVERRDLVRTVDVTGEIKPASRIALSFEHGGTVIAIHKNVGDVVAAGDLLAEVQNDDAEIDYRSAKASLAIAVANLNKIKAGERTEIIRIAESSVLQAEASLKAARTELENLKKTVASDIESAEIAVHTAENKLSTSRAELEAAVKDAYDDARVTMLGALGPMQTALADGDSIIGVDDTASNYQYKNSLGVWAPGSLDSAKQTYAAAKPAATKASTAVKALSAGSAASDIESALQLLESALLLTQSYLIDVQRVLAGSVAGSNFPQATLDAKKTSINSHFSTISTQISNVVSARQTIASSKLNRTNTLSDLEDALASAKLALLIAKIKSDTSVQSAEANVAVKDAALQSALADLALKKAGPRAVDLAPLSAAVEEAEARLALAESKLRENQIMAPVHGTISEIIPEIGEMAIANTVAIRMIGTEAYDIETLIPEADVAKIRVGQEATITLDAYGDDVLFKGTVLSVEPDQTLVQDAVYYKARVQIEMADREIRPGMTANITVLTAKETGVLVIPARAVKTKENGETVVRVLDQGTIREAVVILGLRGDEGRVAVIDGLKEGETIIVSERKP